LRDTADFVRTSTGVTPRSFLADGGQRFSRWEKTEIFAEIWWNDRSSIIFTTQNSLLLLSEFSVDDRTRFFLLSLVRFFLLSSERKRKEMNI